MKIFATFNSNLKQLRVNLELNCDKNVDDLNIEIQKGSFAIKTSGNDDCYDVDVSPNLSLVPDSLSHFSGSSTDHLLDLTFVVEATSEVSDGKSKQHHAGSGFVPPNPEVLNDWIYCHNHESQSDCGTKSGGDHRPPYHLSSREDVVCFIKKMDIGSLVLMESLNKKDNLLVRLLNPHCVIFLYNGNSSKINLHPEASSCILEYKLLSTDYDDELTEIKVARASFSIEWIQVTSDAFSQVSQEMITISSNLPKSLLLSDDGFLKTILKS